MKISVLIPAAAALPIPMTDAAVTVRSVRSVDGAARFRRLLAPSSVGISTTGADIQRMAVPTRPTGIPTMRPKTIVSMTP
jgi:hypothetical protein